MHGAMVEPHVSLDPHGLSPVEQKLRGPLEDQLSSALQAAADRIRDRYAGEPLDVVTAQLLAETKAGLHPDIAAGWQPDPGELEPVAQSIMNSRS
jgi:hypothetical protein